MNNVPKWTALATGIGNGNLQVLGLPYSTDGTAKAYLVAWLDSSGAWQR